MIKTVSYGPTDLKRGKCKCCSQQSSEIVIGEDLCVDCLQMIEFEEMIMKQNIENDEQDI